MNYTLLRLNNQFWIFLNTSLIFPLIILGIIDINTCIKTSSSFGIVFLVLTLIPSNLIKMKIIIFTNVLFFISKHRRDFGITASLMFIVHSIASIIFYGGLSFDFLLSKEILYGVIAELVFITLLLTSNKFSIKILKSKWTLLQSAIWIILPFALLHAILSRIVYVSNSGLDISIVPITSFVGLIIFGLNDFFMLSNHRNRFKHLCLVIIGIVICICIYFIGRVPTLYLKF